MQLKGSAANDRFILIAWITQNLIEHAFLL